MTTVSIHIPQFAQTLETNIGEFLYDAQGALAYEVKLSCNLSVADARKIFTFRTDADDFTAETVQAKYNSNLTDIHLLHSRLNNKTLNIPQYTNDNTTKYTEYVENGFIDAPRDFLQQLALAVFGSTTAVDLFSNEFALSLNYRLQIETAAHNINNIAVSVAKLVDDEAEPGTYVIETETTSTGGRGSLEVIMALFNQTPERFTDITSFTQNADGFREAPFIVGDMLSVMVTIESNSAQPDAAGNILATPVSRRCLIEINLVDSA